MSDQENTDMFEMFQIDSERDEKELENKFPYLIESCKIPTISNEASELSMNIDKFEINHSFDFHFNISPKIVFEEKPAYFELHDHSQRVPTIIL